MNNLQQILTFASVAKHCSFAAAARELGQSASATAKSIARLEKQLGIKIFHRTTRHVSLTPDGENLYGHCQRILDEVDYFKAVAAGVSGSVSGTLKIDMPTTYGKKIVLPLLTQLQNQYPELEIDARFSDRYSDLISEGLDALIRIGPLSDSRLVAQTIGTQQLIVCGSSEYLRQIKKPNSPYDLARHQCVLFRVPTTGRSRAWQFKVEGADTEVRPNSKLRLDDGEALVAAACAGMGLIQVPDYMAAEAMKNGQLKEVLNSFRTDPVPINIVYPGKRFLPPRVRVLIDALKLLNQKR